MIKKLLIGLVGLLILLVVAVVAVPFLVPIDTVRTQVQNQVEQATGRTLTIGGDVALSVFPTAKVTLNDVTLANAEGALEANMVTLDRVDVALQLLPLISGAVEVDRFVLEQPVVNLEIAEDGTPNWVFPAMAGGDASADAASEGEGAGGDGGVPSVSLGEVRIEGGAFSFVDRRSGQTISVADANLTVEASSLTAPVAVDGSATVQGTPVTLSVAVDTVQRLMDGGSADIGLSIASDPLTLSVDGSASAAASPAFNGEVSLSVPSISGLVEWVGVSALPPSPLPVDRVEFTGVVGAAPTDFSLSGFRLAVDDMSVGGDFAVNLDDVVPAIQGEIAISAIDLDAIRAALAAGEVAEDATGQAPSSAPEAPVDPMTQPIDLSPLGMAQVDLTVDLAGLQVEGASVGEARARVQLQDRLLQINLDETAIFNGTVALTATADGVADVPSFAGSLMLDGVDVSQLAARVSMPSVSGLAGALTGEIAVEAAGATPAELLGDIRARSTLSLTGGAATVSPAPGQELAISRATLSVSLPNIDGPLDIGGNADLNGETVSVEASVGNPRGLLAGESVAVRTAVSSSPFSQSFNGTVAGMGQALAGAVEVAIPSLVGVGDWLSLPVPDGLPIDSIALAADTQASLAGVALSSLDLTAGDITAAGSLGVSLAGPVPSLTADLDIGALNLDALAGGQANGGTDDGGSAGSTEGWSSDPMIDYSPLLMANADLDLRINGVTVQGITTGPTRLSADLQGGVLNATLADTGIFDGSVGGTISANAGSETLGLGLRIGGVNAGPLLSQFAGIDWLSGSLDATADLTTAGRSQAQLVAALNGAGNVLFRDGAIEGINVAAVLRNPLQAIANPGMLAQESTDFAELGGSFTATNGVVSNPDLYMLAPLFRINGAGDVDLPPQALDYRVETTLTATLEGQGGEVSQPGLVVPIRITGTFDAPRYSIDMRPEDALQFLGSPEQAVERVRDALEGGAEGVVNDLLEGVGGDVDVGEILESGDPGTALQNALGGLLGGGAAEPEPETAPEQAPTDTTTEAVPTPGSADEQPTAPPPATVEEQVQDVVEDAIEDAVGGALRGLFGN